MNRLILHTIRATLAFSVVGLSTLVARAADPAPESAATTGLINPLNKIGSFPQLLTALLGAVVTIGSIVLVLALVYTGFLFVAAQGNEEKIRSAKGALMWTVIGGLILLGAQTIGMVIETTVNNLK